MWEQVNNTIHTLAISFYSSLHFPYISPPSRLKVRRGRKWHRGRDVVVERVVSKRCKSSTGITHNVELLFPAVTVSNIQHFIVKTRMLGGESSS
jgi:hypothetical protein